MDIVAEIEIDETKYWDFPHNSAFELAFSGLARTGLGKNRSPLSLNLSVETFQHICEGFVFRIYKQKLMIFETFQVFL